MNELNRLKVWHLVATYVAIFFLYRLAPSNPVRTVLSDLMLILMIFTGTLTVMRLADK
jgi:hypothetical protein